MTTSITLYEGDNREHLRRLASQGVQFESAVMDPPYGLVSMTKRFGKAGSTAARTDGNDGSFSRLSGGFMGKAWDATGIERDPEFWKLVLDVLKPGAFCFAFSGSTTGHWQACAMETAGFIMHPMHGWLYGQGFPKAHDAARAIDKQLGVEGTFGDPKSAAHAGWIDRGRMRGGEDGVAHEGWQRAWMDDPEKVSNAARQYLPGSPEGQDWFGWRFGTQSQKPALEPIFLAQKPISEKTYAANLLKHGVGAVNVDGCRVHDPSQSCDGTDAEGRQGHIETNGFSENKGRYPANLILDDSDAVADLFPSQAEMFFNRFSHDIPAGFYHSKAGKADRAGIKHPTVKPIGLLRHLIRHITPPGGVVLDAFGGTGTTAEAARQEGFDCVLMEQDPSYCAGIKQRFFSQNVKDPYCVDANSSLDTDATSDGSVGLNGTTEVKGLSDAILTDLLGVETDDPLENLLG